MPDQRLKGIIPTNSDSLAPIATAPNVTDLRPVTLDEGGALALKRRWVAFREDPVKGGRLAKVPYTPDGKRRAASDKPATWGTRAEAEAGAHLLHVAAPDRKCGMGIILGAWTATSRTCLGGIDLDTCFNEAGKLQPWAADIVAALPTYWEISINGAGLHALFRYRAEGLERLRQALKKHGNSHSQKSDKPHPPGAEIYIEKQYLAVSENQLPGSTDSIREIATEDLLRVIEVLAPAVAGRNRGKQAPDTSRSGRAWHLAIKTVANGKGRRTFHQGLVHDPDLAEWAAENHPHNEDRAWEQAVAKYGWMAELKRHGTSGAPICNLDNALQYLRHAEDLAGLFAYDEMLQAEMLLKPIPGSGEAWTGPRPIRDTDVTAVREWLQENWLVSVTKDIVFDAVAKCARERSYHPVRDYLKRAEWDGLNRLDSWLAVYLGGEHNDYTSAIGRMFLIAMVARIFRPGCKVDYVMNLEGKQGAQKSTALGVLAGEWFSDAMPDIRDSRLASQHLDGKWLIEISELSAMRKADIEALKAFIMRTHERYFKRYARTEVIEPRQCVYVGTTNESKYLPDATSNRRYWPVMTGTVDIDALRRDRDHLFAEAVVCFQHGEKWWPDRDFEARTIKPEQDARCEEDPWADLIRNHLWNKTETTVEDIVTVALGITKANLHPSITRRITPVLRREGWVLRHTKAGNVWIYDI
jgi:predicted P-loop ATPase